MSKALKMLDAQIDLLQRRYEDLDLQLDLLFQQQTDIVKKMIELKAIRIAHEQAGVDIPYAKLTGDFKPK